MTFDCEKYKSVCGSRCCSCFPMPKKLWEKNKNKAVRKVAELQTFSMKDEERIIVLTYDMLCTFLDYQLNCRIYDDRPPICRNFGNEKFPFMHCPFQHTDGTPR